MKKSELEEMFIAQCDEHELPLMVTQLKFHPKRRWKFDACFPDYMLAVEIEGGTWMPKSRHTSGIGFEKDCEKYSNAMLLGWNVYRCTGTMVKDGRAIEMTQRLLEKLKNG